jgi:3-dehydroshikimate dehydratase
MIDVGVCSLTLGKLEPVAVIDQCLRTGLTHIEWWGREQGHVPMGAIGTATRVGEWTRQAGLTTAGYGSYYRAGESEQEGLAFSAVLETARALQAPYIRVWAGAKGTAEYDQAGKAAVVNDALRIADLSAEHEIDVVFEYHQNTLTDSNEHAEAFMQAASHPAIFSGWQPRTGVPHAENVAGLRGVLPRLGTVHVFNWTHELERMYCRHPLSEARQAWGEYFKIVRESGRDHVALLEFCKEDRLDCFADDAKSLIELTTEG